MYNNNLLIKILFESKILHEIKIMNTNKKVINLMKVIRK
jgi:hypothetical protein